MRAIRFRLWTLAAVIFALLLICSIGAAEHTGKCGDDLTWTFQNGELRISGTGPMYDYTSARVNGALTSTAPWRMGYFGDDVSECVDKVVIEEGVTHIGNYAFYQLWVENSITMPSTLATIGNYAFSETETMYMFYSGREAQWNSISMGINNDSLDSVMSLYCGDNATWAFDNGTLTISGSGPMYDYSSDYSLDIDIPLTTAPWRQLIPTGRSITSICVGKGITSIGRFAFYGCGNVTSVSIADTVLCIGQSAFEMCDALQAITIPSGVVRIEEYAFAVSSRLERVYISETCTDIASNAFILCKNMTSLDVSDLNPYYASDGISLWTKSSGALRFVPTGIRGDYRVPDGITSIEGNALCDVLYMTTVTIPPSVTKLISCHDELYEGEMPGPQNILYSGPESAWDAIPKNAFWMQVNVTCDVCEHVWGEASYTWDADNRTVTATRCCTIWPSHTESETVSVQSTVTRQPTCTETGETTYTSSAFANSTFEPQTKTLADISPLGHNWGAATYTWNEDHTAVTASHVCANDHSHTESETVTAAGAVTLQPTCTQVGETTYTSGAFTNPAFSVQAKTIGNIPATGHTAVTDAEVPPSCTDTGLTQGSHCSVCGEVLVPQETVAALGHSAVIDAPVDPTCTESGLTQGSHCSVCGEVLEPQNRVAALGHQVVLDMPVAPTCTGTGLTQGSHCTVCGTILVAQTVVPANGHTGVIDPAVAPDCTNPGLTEGSHCSVCGETLIAQIVLPALGHTIVIDEAIAPSCVDDGISEGSHCAVCGEVLVPQEYIPALGHTTVIDPAVTPTDTQPGLTEGSHCDVCGEVLIPQEYVHPRLWSIENTGKQVTILRYHGSDAMCSIPSFLEGVHVRAIADHAFGADHCPERVYIPSGIQSIGQSAFASPVIVYCNEYYEADYWADETGYPKIYVDDTRTGTFYVVTLPEPFTMEYACSEELDITVWPVVGNEQIVVDSSDRSIIDVSGHTLTALGVGEATISLSVGGITRTVTVTVHADPTDFSITDGHGNTGEIPMITKTSQALFLDSIEPAGAEMNMTWQSSNTAVATVSPDGVVQGKRTGEAIISATAQNGLTRSCVVVVCLPVTGISFTQTDVHVGLGCSKIVSAQAVTSTGSYHNRFMTFSSSDETIATVDDDGKVYGIAAGTVTITAASEMDSGICAACTVTVGDPIVLDLPDSLSVIESQAFRGIMHADAIRLPFSVTDIAPDAFDPDMTLIVPSGSRWVQWAVEHGYGVIEE